MRFFAVIDTNVLVSAAMKPESVPGKVLELVLDGLIIPIFNKAIMKEYRNVLLRPKFAFSEQIVTDILNEMSDRGICVDAERLTVDLPDPKDIVFYHSACESKPRLLPVLQLFRESRKALREQALRASKLCAREGRKMK